MFLKGEYGRVSRASSHVVASSHACLVSITTALSHTVVEWLRWRDTDKEFCVAFLIIICRSWRRTRSLECSWLPPTAVGYRCATSRRTGRPSCLRWMLGRDGRGDKQGGRSGMTLHRGDHISGADKSPIIANTGNGIRVHHTTSFYQSLFPQISTTIVHLGSTGLLITNRTSEIFERYPIFRAKTFLEISCYKNLE